MKKGIKKTRTRKSRRKKGRKTRIRRCRRSIIRGNIRRIRMEYGGT